MNVETRCTSRQRSHVVCIRHVTLTTTERFDLQRIVAMATQATCDCGCKEIKTVQAF